MRAAFPWYIAMANHFYRYRFERISHNRHRSKFAVRLARHLKILCKMHIVMIKIAQPHSRHWKMKTEKSIIRRFLATRGLFALKFAFTYSMRIKDDICKIFRWKYCNWNGLHFTIYVIILIDVWLPIFSGVLFARTVEKVRMFGIVVVPQMAFEFFHRKIVDEIN